MIDLVAVGPEDANGIQAAREMFLEYRSELGIDLCFQGFDEEIESLPGKYGPPDGRLLVAYDEESPIACGGLRDLGGRVCELKRIYVRPGSRRSGVGRRISEHLIEFGREAGYSVARLDTLGRLSAAVRLYEDLGFSFIEPYNQSPEPDTLYMELRL